MRIWWVPVPDWNVWTKVTNGNGVSFPINVLQSLVANLEIVGLRSLVAFHPLTSPSFNGSEPLAFLLRLLFLLSLTAIHPFCQFSLLSQFACLLAWSIDKVKIRTLQGLRVLAS